MIPKFLTFTFKKSQFFLILSIIIILLNFFIFFHSLTFSLTRTNIRKNLGKFYRPEQLGITTNSIWFLSKYRAKIPNYEDIRSVLLYILPVLLFHIIINFSIQKISNYIYRDMNENKKIYPRLIINIVISFIFIFLLSGLNIIFIMMIVIGNYCLGLVVIKGIKMGKKKKKIIMYMYNGILFLYMISPIKIHLTIWNRMGIDGNVSGIAIYDWGSITRICFLRLISYSIDKIDDLNKIKKVKYDSFLIYLYYVLYTPLFFAGPVIDFDDFYIQIFEKQLKLKYDWKYLMKESGKLIGMFIFYDILSHFCYFSDVLYRYKTWDMFSSFEITIIFYFGAFILFWGKYYILFGVSRIWSLMDGINVLNDTPVCSFQITSAMHQLITWHLTIFNWSMKYIFSVTKLPYYLNFIFLYLFGVLIHGTQYFIFEKYFIFFVIPIVIEIVFDKLFSKYKSLSFIFYALFHAVSVPFHFTPYEVPTFTILYKMFLSSSLKNNLIVISLVILFFLSKYYINIHFEKRTSSEMLNGLLDEYYYFKKEDNIRKEETETKTNDEHIVKDDDITPV